ncbi:DinB family protein [Thalassoglobus sp. JC818]|uniref:DinB family protein n=1 Tax=Thalassoglobus sp. JC818 TaxID=3232136 RepID=UPI0034597187
MDGLESLRLSLNMSFEWIIQLAEDLADAPLAVPTSRGGNHAHWTMGHLVFSQAGLTSMISGRPNTWETWKSLFAGGTRPHPEGDGYPTYTEVLTAYRTVHVETLQLLETIGVSGLDDAPKAVWESLRDQPDFQSNGRLFVFIAMHDMAHFGQLADVRRSLGRKPFA